MQKRYPPDWNAKTGLPEVLRTGKPVYFPEITDEMFVASARDPEHLAMMRKLGLRSAFSIPLITRGRTLGAISLGWAESKRESSTDRMDNAGRVLREIMAAPDNGIPEEVLEHAKCIAVVPHMMKGGLVFGARNGRGLATCRTANGWSAPAFFAITGGSWGLQIGLESVDLIMIIQNEKGMQQLLASTTGVSEADRKRFANLGTHFGSDYPAFFERLALRRGIDDLEPGQEAVNIMTIHAAKGLEFKAVFIPGCEEGIIPFELFGEKTPEEREEEKRLLYVGITRTRKYLLLSYAKKRVFKGRLLELRKSSLLEQLEQALLNQGEQKPKKRDGQLNLFPFKEG
jgi:hypothetical protein